MNNCTPKHGRLWGTIFLFIVFVIGREGLLAQTSGLDGWQEQVQSRLHAIYDRGEFRPLVVEPQWLPDGSGYLVWEPDPQTGDRCRAKYDLHTGDRTEFVQDESAGTRKRGPRSPDCKYELVSRWRELVVRDLTTGEETRLTEYPRDRDVTYRDAAWSPDSKRIVFVESDHTQVRQRSVLTPSDPSYPGVRQDRFARVGETIPTLRVGVISLASEETHWLPIQRDYDDFYVGHIGWAGNSHEVLIETFSRYRDEREFSIVNVDMNEVHDIYREANAAWAIGSQGKNAGLNWICGGQEFIVISERDGWRHAYLYSRDGEQLELLTAGDYDLIDRGAVDEEGGWFYFYASPKNGTHRYLYRVPLEGSATLERITPVEQRGTHEYHFSPDLKWAFHTFSTMDMPPVVSLVELPSHRVVRVLEDNDELRSKTAYSTRHPTEFLNLDIGNGVSMDAFLMKPNDFDASKKYPVLVYVYGEPHAQTVVDKWGAAQSHFHRVVADLGYIVLSIDNQGTPAPKGAAWRRSIFGSLGPLSTEDQAAGLQAVGRMKPYVDLSRVAIWGWSGGGSNTLNAMFRKPDLYHVGIAVVPKPQPHLYNAEFQEIYMRTPEVNPDGYERSAPMNFADGLKGKLLIITGSGETNTHIQIIEGLVDRLVELGKVFDYMVYPNRDHGLSEGPGTLVHVRMLIIRYLVENLQSGPR